MQHIFFTIIVKFGWFKCQNLKIHLAIHAPRYKYLIQTFLGKFQDIAKHFYYPSRLRCDAWDTWKEEIRTNVLYEMFYWFTTHVEKNATENSTVVKGSDWMIN